MNLPKYRPLDFPVKRVEVREAPGGVRYLRSEPPLAGHAARMTDRLVHWAQVAPDRTFMARRERLADGSTGDWRHISYGQALDSARRIAQALLDRGLGPERPVAILSENDLEHALLALGCIYAGVPFCPVSPAYSIVSEDYDKLRHALKTLTPGLVFASDAARYGKAIAATVPADVEVVVANGTLPGRTVTPFAELLATNPTPAVDAAMQATGPETIVKFLFTSGSTRLPKAVINTHQMWCANQQQMRQSMPVLDRGAGAGRLAALEPHLRRQPQFRPDAVQRRHALHRRRQAGAGADRRDPAQPARDRAHRLLQRADRLRGDRQRDEGGRGAAAQPAVARADVLLRRGGAGPAGLGCAARGAGARNRRAHRDGHRPGHDRIGALRHLHHQSQRQGRLPGRADARHGAQAGAAGRQGRGSLQGPERHARLLARARGHAPNASTTKGSSAPAMPCAGSTRATCTRA